MSSVSAAVSGRLSQFPLAQLLWRAFQKKWGGTLVLEEEIGRKHAIALRGGVAIKVKTATPVVYLGQILVNQHKIAEDVYQHTLNQALQSKTLHGEVLLCEGIVDGSTLMNALREQLSQQVEQLSTLPGNTLYGFYDNAHFLAHWGTPRGIDIDPYALIWRAFRIPCAPEREASVMAALGNHPLCLRSDAPLAQCGLTAVESGIVEGLRTHPQAITDLMRQGILEPERLRRFISALYEMSMLEPMSVSSQRILAAPPAVSISVMPDSESPPKVNRVASNNSNPVTPRWAKSESVLPRRIGSGPVSVAPGITTNTIKPAERDRRTEIIERARRTGESHYEVLGVPSQAPPATIQGAFLELAKKWHPDRIAPDLADLRDQVTRVFARMTDAHRVLSDPVKRRSYDQQRTQGSDKNDEQEQVHRVLMAATAFQKAEVFLKRNQLALAEQEARRALENDPSQADYAALLVWIESLKSNPDLTKLLERIDAAIGLDENNLRARWYRGQLLKRAGKLAKAALDFRFVVENDPRHLDAQRELRLHEMRRISARPSNPTGKARTHSTRAPKVGGEPNKEGLLGKWFKR